MVRSIMHAKNKPKGFSAEAIFYAVYVSNRSIVQCNFEKAP